MSLVLLVGVTWRLWLSPSEFPQVPLLRFAIALPTVFDRSALALLLASTVGSLVAGPAGLQRWRHLSLLVSVGCLMILFVTNQHRLQPWAFQISWVLLAIALCRAVIALRMLRVFVVSIYFFSGLSKIDYQFVYTTGREFLDGLVGLVGLSIELWPESLKIAVTLSFPVVEVFIAAALVARRTRTLAVLLAIGMHVTLFVLLGPLGLGHQPGVLLWNLVSAALVGLLFWKGPNAAGDSGIPADAPPRRYRLQPLAVGMLCVVSAAPLLEPLGRYDHWLAWGLYAPHNSRVRMLVDERAAEQLPDSLRAHLQPIAGDWPAVYVPLDRWSIDCLSVPIYPQARFQVGVAFAVLRESGIRSGFRLEVLSDSNRRTGQRTIDVIRNLDQLKLQLNRFTFNAIPRNDISP